MYLLIFVNISEDYHPPGVHRMKLAGQESLNHFMGNRCFSEFGQNHKLVPQKYIYFTKAHFKKPLQGLIEATDSSFYTEKMNPRKSLSGQIWIPTMFPHLY